MGVRSGIDMKKKGLARDWYPSLSPLYQLYAI